MPEKRKQTLNPVRQPVVVFGDQLDRESSAFDSFDQRLDHVLMIASAGEATTSGPTSSGSRSSSLRYASPTTDPKGELP
jgi:hypothetical protein